jgi:hypothetical protein
VPAITADNNPAIAAVGDVHVPLPPYRPHGKRSALTHISRPPLTGHIITAASAISNSTPFTIHKKIRSVLRIGPPF